MTEDERNRALASLPHGVEFRFIDEVTDLAPGRSAAGTYRLRGDEVFLRGHFPGRPMMPGVLMIEAVAQLAGVAAQSDPTVPSMADLRLAAVRAAKISGTIAPGDTVEVVVHIDGRLDGLVQARGRVTHDNREILSAQVTLSGSVAS